MRITTLAEYGVICALHLARRAAEGPITGREIAESERLPGDYVEQILLRLRRAGIVRSTRGARGGYELARPAERVSIRNVIEASETTTFDCTVCRIRSVRNAAHRRTPAAFVRCGCCSSKRSTPCWKACTCRTC